MPDWSKINCFTNKSPMGLKLSPNFSMHKCQGLIRYKLIDFGGAEMWNAESAKSMMSIEPALSSISTFELKLPILIFGILIDLKTCPTTVQ